MGIENGTSDLADKIIHTLRRWPKNPNQEPSSTPFYRVKFLSFLCL